METGPKVGVIGKRVAGNAAYLRDHVRKYSVREFSKRLDAAGRYIDPSGCTKLEKGVRRVDVDDLVALAVALDVTPNRLLLDPESDDSAVMLTEEVQVTRERSWQWANGDRPLPEAGVDERRHYDADRIERFQRENRPNRPETGTRAYELPALMEAMQPVINAVITVTEGGDTTFEQMMEGLQVWNTMRRIDAQAAAVKNRTMKKASAKGTSKRRGR